MKKQNNFLTTVLLCLILLLISGCTNPQNTGIITGSELKPNDSVANRFTESKSADQNKTVIDSAVALSDKYAQLTARAADMENVNKELAKENYQLKINNTQLENKLKEVEAELSAANGLLIEMVSELNDWKASIMGFRSEMRQASTAQLQALLKVLESLGVETNIKNLEPIAGLKDQNQSGAGIHDEK